MIFASLYMNYKDVEVKEHKAETRNIKFVISLKGEKQDISDLKEMENNYNSKNKHKTLHV